MKPVYIVNATLSIPIICLFIFSPTNHVIQLVTVIFSVIESIVYIILMRIRNKKRVSEYFILTVPVLIGVSFIRFQLLNIPYVYIGMSICFGIFITAVAYYNVSKNTLISILETIAVTCVWSMSIFSSILYLNLIFDHSIPYNIEANITDTIADAGRGIFITDYYIYADMSADNKLDNYIIHLGKSEYDKCNKGETINIVIQKGGLNISYYYMPGDSSIH